jgi:hypothetical protein
VAHLLDSLHDELNAAGIFPTYIGGDKDDPDKVVIEVPDDTDPEAVQAVIDAHDVTAIEAAADAKRTQYQNDLAAIKAFMAAANGSATNAQRDAVFKAFVRVARDKWQELRD